MQQRQIDLSALGVQSASVMQTMYGANVYEVGVFDDTAFKILVTTTGGVLSASDITV